MQQRVAQLDTNDRFAPRRTESGYRWCPECGCNADRRCVCAVDCPNHPRPAHTVAAPPVVVATCDDDEPTRWQVCPRCGASSPERFYGPCTSCRDDLLNVNAPPMSAGRSDVRSVIPRERGATTLAAAGGLAATLPQPTSAGVTRRQPRSFRPRPTEWAKLLGTVYEQLDQLGPAVERVYLIGPRPAAGWRSWATGELPPGWTAGGHYLEGAHPVLRFTQGDQRVELHRAEAWYGERADLTEDGCREAFGVLGELVALRFDQGQLLATPASTGRYLMMRSLGGREFPVLDDDTQQLIRSTSGQGRIELLPDVRPDRAPLAQLVEYDGRLMYAGCVRELGHGVPTRDSCDEYAGHQRGRYRVRFTVPKDWAHVGLLGVKSPDGGWFYPATPGGSYECWCDGVELGIALRHHWKVSIVERLLFPENRGRPLDGWAANLVAIRQALLAQTAAGALSMTVGAAAADGVRAIILHGIGALHGRPHRITKASSNAADVPAEAGDSWRVEGDVHLWAEGDRQGWAAMAHPEWSAAVWARARARLLAGPGGVGALSVPRAQVVAFRTDAIYLTNDPRWPDDGAVGRLRRQRVIDGPLPWPSSSRQLLDTRGAR